MLTSRLSFGSRARHIYDPRLRSWEEASAGNAGAAKGAAASTAQQGDAIPGVLAIPRDAAGAMTPRILAVPAYVYSVCIARINVYLPDELAEAIRPLGWNLSQVLQSAVRERLNTSRLDAWLSELNPPTTGAPDHRQTSAALEPEGR